MTLATLTGGPTTFTFRTNPSTMNLDYQLKTSVQDTYAGKVVQILGIEYTTLSVTAEGGSGREAYLLSVFSYVRSLVKWQKENESPVTFRFPSQNIELKVFFESFTLSNKTTNVDYPYTLNFVIQEDATGLLTKNTIAKELKRLQEGIGYDEDSKYVNPEDSINEPEPMTAADGAFSGGGSGEGGGTPPPASELGAAIIAAGRKYTGTKYVWGGGGLNGPTNGGFDCSGFTQYAVYEGSGKKIKISRTAHTQQSDGVEVSRDQMAPGDLVMFTKKGAKRAHHVVIYLGNDRVLHAPRTGRTVGEDSISAWSNQNWKIRRMTL